MAEKELLATTGWPQGLWASSACVVVFYIPCGHYRPSFPISSDALLYSLEKEKPFQVIFHGMRRSFRCFERPQETTCPCDASGQKTRSENDMGYFPVA